MAMLAFLPEQMLLSEANLQLEPRVFFVSAALINLAGRCLGVIARYASRVIG